MTDPIIGLIFVVVVFAIMIATDGKGNSFTDSVRDFGAPTNAKRARKGRYYKNKRLRDGKTYKGKY